MYYWLHVYIKYIKTDFNLLKKVDNTEGTYKIMTLEPSYEIVLDWT